MKILLTTEEGLSKPKGNATRNKRDEKKCFLSFNGNDAPDKAVETLIQKYGVGKESPINAIKSLMKKYRISVSELVE